VDAATRLLNLAALIESSSQPMSAAAIREAMGTYSLRDEAFRRMFERDKKELIRMGVPLVTLEDPDQPSSSVYRIESVSRVVSDPGLNPAERAALQSAVTSLDLQDAGPESLSDAAPALRKLGMMSASTVEMVPAAMAVDSTLGRLFGAIVDRKGVHLSYLGKSRRLVPRQLAHRNGCWYLRASDFGASEVRSYRVDRIEGPVLVDSEKQDEVPLTPLDSLTMNPWEFGAGEATEVTVRLDPDVAPGVLLLDDIEVAASHPDGSVDVTLHVRSEQGLHNWLFDLLDHAVLLEPDDFRQRFVDHLNELVEAGAR
jgi:proteasome accessory factor B